MTQEEKTILLQDLCARLPYNLYVRIEEFNVPKNEAITEGFVGNYLKDNRCNDYDADDILNELADDCICIKPYLRPMSSMTEEENKEAKENGCIIYWDTSLENKGLLIFASPKGFDWLNKKMFDYHGLIEGGLAIEASEGMYK